MMVRENRLNELMDFLQSNPNWNINETDFLGNTYLIYAA